MRRPRLEGWAAIGALLRRDLATTRRGAATAAIRGIVVVLSSAVALLALSEAEHLYGAPDEAAVAGWMVTWALVVAALLFLPVQALQALRRERESGRLDLLLLAGLSPRALAFGRWLSSFLFLESLLLDALPALAVFSYFGAPEPTKLAWGALALSGWNALLAGIAVLLSASIRRAGACAAAAVIAGAALVGVSLWTLGKDSRARRAAVVAPIPTVVLSWLTIESVVPGRVRLTAVSQCAGAGACLAGGALLALLGGTGLERRRHAVARGPRRPARGPWLRGLAGLGRPGPLRGESFRWLLLRTSVALRPAVLSLALAAALLLIAGGLELRGRLGPLHGRAENLLDPRVLTAACGAAWALALLLAALGCALQVARARERGEWDTLLTTARRGRSLILGLLRGPTEAALVPAVVAVGLIGVLQLGSPWAVAARSPGAWDVTLGLLGSLALALALGLAAGLCARSSGAAMGLCLLLMGTAAIEGAAVGAWLDGTDLGTGFDAASRGWAVALAVALVLPLQVFLLDRSRLRPGPGRLFFDLSCGALIVSPPLVHAMMETHGSRLDEHAPLFGLACASLAVPLLIVLLRRPDRWLGRTG